MNWGLPLYRPWLSILFGARALLRLLLASARQLGLSGRPMCLSLEHPKVQTGGGVSRAKGKVGLQGAEVQDLGQISAKVCHEDLLNLYAVGCRIGYVEAGLLQLADASLRVLGLVLVRSLLGLGGGQLGLSYEQDARWQLRGEWCRPGVRPSLFLHRRPVSWGQRIISTVVRRTLHQASSIRMGWGEALEILGACATGVLLRDSRSLSISCCTSPLRPLTAASAAKVASVASHSSRSSLPASFIALIWSELVSFLSHSALRSGTLVVWGNTRDGSMLSARVTLQWRAGCGAGLPGEGGGVWV